MIEGTMGPEMFLWLQLAEVSYTKLMPVGDSVQNEMNLPIFQETSLKGNCQEKFPLQNVIGFFNYIKYMCQSLHCNGQLYGDALKSQRSTFTHLSHCNSVCLSICSSQSKTVQARITKSLPSAVWKTLVSGTVKLFHKFEGVTLNEGAKWEGGGAELAIFGQ